MRVTERVARREEAKAASRRRRSGKFRAETPRRWRSVVEGDRGGRRIIFVASGMRLAPALTFSLLFRLKKLGSMSFFWEASTQKIARCASGSPPPQKNK